MRSVPDPGVISRNAKDHPVATTEALVTISADTDHFWVIDRVDVSFDQDPGSVESLTIAINAVTVWKVEIPNGWTGGPLGFVFPHGLYTTVKNQDVTVSLSAPTAGTGKVNVSYR